MTIDLKLLKKSDAKAQRELYNAYSAQMHGLCRRYIKNDQDAEEIMIQGFFKVMSKIHSYKAEGSFESWMKRIMVRECLMFLRMNKRFAQTLELEQAEEPVYFDNIESQLSANEILNHIKNLPDGYRTVFNLYCIEGYKHREIADMMNISINTSKSQLILARKKLRKLILNDEKKSLKNETA